MNLLDIRMSESDGNGMRRNHFRLAQPAGTEALLQIVRLGESGVSSSTARIQVRDIGPGGVGFSSSLKFPVSRTVVYRFSFVFSGEPFELEGTIVWSETGPDCCRYGAEFILTDFERVMLARRLIRCALSRHDYHKRQAYACYALYQMRPKRFWREPENYGARVKRVFSHHTQTHLAHHRVCRDRGVGDGHRQLPVYQTRLFGQHENYRQQIQ